MAINALYIKNVHFTSLLLVFLLFFAQYLTTFCCPTLTAFKCYVTSRAFVTGVIADDRRSLAALKSTRVLVCIQTFQ